MAINASRKEFYLKYRGEPVPAWFQHTPAASKPAQPTFPGTLTTNEQTEVKAWRSTRGTAKTALYNALTANAKTKADLFIAWDLALKAWVAADNAARQEQFAWFKADAAISNYDTVPPSGSNAGTGSGAPATPLTKQEP